MAVEAAAPCRRSPADEEPDKPLAVAKVLIATLVLVGAGVVVFAIAQRKRRKLIAGGV